MNIDINCVDNNTKEEVKIWRLRCWFHTYSVVVKNDLNVYLFKFVIHELLSYSYVVTAT